MHLYNALLVSCCHFANLPFQNLDMAPVCSYFALFLIVIGIELSSVYCTPTLPNLLVCTTNTTVTPTPPTSKNVDETLMKDVSDGVCLFGGKCRGNWQEMILIRTCSRP